MTEITEVILRFHPATQAVYLFGSHLTSDQTPNSDVDIAVLLAHNDSSVLKLSECEFAHNGRLILIQDRNAVAEFEMLTMSFYQKLNEERGDILAEFARTGRAYNV
jgi:uncharacterized protein